MSESGYKVAVIGATGAVGKMMLEILQQRKFPAASVDVVASERSAGTEIQFSGKQLVVQALDGYDFEGVDIALFSAGGAISEEYAPKAARSGAVVIDNSSTFRYQPDVPLIIPEVNPQALSEYRERNIIANPNCSTMQLLVALKPLYDAVGISRIEVATYQSVSGLGNKGISALVAQTGRLLNGLPIEDDIFQQQMAFNVIPHIDTLEDNGYTREEMKMVWETRKILADNNIQINPTAVRVPVFYGHSEAVFIKTDNPITVQQAEQLLQQAAGVELKNSRDPFEYATPVTDATGSDSVFVSRVREDLYQDNGLNLWIVSDNIRKGAALNAVQIAELLVKSYL
jgi:aspartate-semialdehyde dehydrogenase